MPGQDRRPVYKFGAWEIDLARREMRLNGISADVGSRAFEIVETLVQSAGELIDKYDLMNRVWPGAAVEENTLQAQISAIRRALGPDRALLKTIAGRGYRLLGDWVIQREDFAAAGMPTAEPARSRFTNLATAPGALIGRKIAEAQLLELLSTYRIVTMTGPGGIGKTVLAQAVARDLLAALGGDGLLVELASLSDPALVPFSVATVLGLKQGGEISFESIVREIGARKLLLVLDNCEHLIEAAARLAETLVRSCPNTTILATSREVLRIDGEYVYRVPPLDVPGQGGDGDHDILGRSAVQLLIARTKALNADFLPRGEDLQLVAAISRQLDGIPLAIEFAAARVATLGLQQVAARLHDRFNLLTRGLRTALPRHQTLLATLDWSYELLSETEARVLRHLAVFNGDFSLDAAAAVTGNLDALSIADSLTGLVVKSLVAADFQAGDDHYRLLDTTRAYALEKLHGAGEHREAARRHAEYFREALIQAEAESNSLPQADWQGRHGRHLGNVRAGLDWAFSADGDSQIGAALTAAAVPLWVHLSLFGECRERAALALARLDDGAMGPTRLRMQLSAALGWSLTYSQGRARDAGPALAITLELADRLDDKDYRLRALWGLCIDQFNNGEFLKALEFAQRFTKAAGDSADPTDLMLADRLLAVSLHFLGDQNSARHHIDQVDASLHLLAEKPKIFPLDLRISTHYFRARILWLQGLGDQALRLVEHNIEEGRANGHALTFCSVLGQGACPIAFLAGDFDAAERYGEMLFEHTERHAIRPWRLWAGCFKGMVMAKRGNLDAGLVLLRSEIDRAGDTRFLPRFLLPLGELAVCLGEANEIEKGLAVVDDTLRRCKARQEQWYVPELLRIKGELMLIDTQHQSASSAEQCFSQALKLARQQGAPFWELRNALSLARLWVGQDRKTEARQILEPAYGAFTEGFQIADVREAKKLLDRLDAD
ncbi:MAG TPA: winged helix-turn-helix domain-containing protein [Bradyrhizobium sp.]|nr:winged helix-turn-helix domain-containing protein [Bradyrhizobium sp.]